MPFRFSAILWIRLVCALAATGIIAALLFAKKPWEILNTIDHPEKLKDFIAIYEWWAGAINALLLLVLGATAHWWSQPIATIENQKSNSDKSRAGIENPKWFWPLTLLAMALTAFWGIQRLPLSLWDDEDSSLHRVILGEYRRNADNTIQLKEVHWREPFWNYKKPTNHQLQTILSKVCLDCWRAATKPKGLQFTEPVVRFPCFVAGVLSVGALALLLRRLGFARAAVVAAFLLALHPWHIRYAVELRGYVFTLLFGPLMLLCLIQAIESGRWRWWLSFAASEFALLYAYPGCLYMLVAANLCGALAIFFHKRMSRQQFLRFLVANTFAGMVYLQLMLPCLPQLLAYLQTERALGVLTSRWHRNMFSHLLAGIPWNNSDMPFAGFPELQWMAQKHVFGFVLLVAIVLICVVIGIIRLGWSRPTGWIVLVVLLLPAPIVYFVSVLKGHYLYEWYLLFALPGFIAFAALGLDAFAALAGRIHRFVTPVILFFGITTFAIATQPQRHVLITRSLQPMRESVLLTRPSLDPYDPRQQHIITVALTAPPSSYDAHIHKIRTIEELIALLRNADQTNRPLYFIYGNGWAAAFGYPKIFKIVEDDTLFEKVAELPGFDPTLTHFIRRYRYKMIQDYKLPATGLQN